MKILSASYLLPIFSPPIREGAVVIDKEKIVETGPRKKIEKKYPTASREEFDNAVLMPGLVNADSHLELSSLEGTTSPSFIDWFFACLEHQQKITPEERRRNIQEGSQRLLRSGTTCIGDVGGYTGIVSDIAETPLRMVLFPEIMTSAGESISDHYQASLEIVEEILSRQSERITAGIAPYSAYTLSRHLLKIIAVHARQTKIPVKIHAATSFAEMQFFFESRGEIAEALFPRLGWTDSLPPAHRKTPIEFLHSIGFLESAPILVGCPHLSDKDLPLLVRSKSKVVWRPRVQKYFQLGETPVSKIQKAKIPLGLGTNGLGGRHSLSLWDEMRAVKAACTAEDLIRLATEGGARVLGLQDQIGTIEKGKKADLICVKIPLSLVKSRSRAALFQHLVDQTTEKEILATYIDGQSIKV
ncbi:MAG: amidohydrolase family protein [Deltaproteobacteria bacterium]|nr:amidohydrolase family protein [Deltaproteobacteria bacterium]